MIEPESFLADPEDREKAENKIIDAEMLAPKKYALTGEVISWGIHRLHRIKALRDIPEAGVSKGELGGFVESEDNLYHSGSCWVYHNAKVFGDAVVYGDARVYGKAIICDKTKISENARVYDYCWVGGVSHISDNAKLSGDVKIESGRTVMRDNALMTGGVRCLGHNALKGNSEVVGESNITIADIVVDDDVRICRSTSNAKYTNKSNDPNSLDENAALRKKKAAFEEYIMSI